MNVKYLETAIHEETNATRQAHGKASLAYDSALRIVARYHSHRMAGAGQLFHIAPHGETLRDRIEKLEYNYLAKSSGQQFCHDCGADLRAIVSPRHCTSCGVATCDSTVHECVLGENLAYFKSGTKIPTVPSPEDIAATIVDGWLNSPEHRENLMREKFNREAIGVVILQNNGFEIYVTQHFS